eukprot:scaffold73897_cov29-Attheya_sp.AAC.1
MAWIESGHNLFHVAPSVQYVPIVYFYDVAYADPALVEDGLTFAPAEVKPRTTIKAVGVRIEAAFNR